MTPEDVRHLAGLNRLSLTNTEVLRLAEELTIIDGIVSSVKEVSTDGVPPTSHASRLVNVYREDEPRESLTPEQILAEAPDVELQQFKVPRMS